MFAKIQPKCIVLLIKPSYSTSMMAFILEDKQITREMDWELCFINNMEFIMKANGSKMSLMALVLWLIPMAIFMRANGKKGCLMAKGST